MNNKLLTISLLIFGLLMAAIIARSSALAWMALPFLAYLGTGLVRAPLVDKIQLSAVRSVEKTFGKEPTEVEVHLSVVNQGDKTVCLRMVDRLQSDALLLSGCLVQRVVLKPGAEARLEYGFSSGRGSFKWEALPVVVSDALCLVETPLDLPCAAELVVHPEINKFRPISMHPNSTLNAPGSIPARRGGSGTDFWGVREYHPGDSLRWLDWRLTARHPHKLFTKEFEQEEIADIGLILDARQKMDLRINDESLFEYAVEATASLAEMFIHQGHRLSMLVYGRNMQNIYPDYGKKQLNRILDCLSRVKIGAGASLDNLDFIPMRLFPSRSLLIVISPIHLNDRSLFPRLRAHGYQVLLISPNPIDFAQPLIPDTLYYRQSVRAARIERHLCLRNIARLHIPVVDWHVHQPLYPMVREALSRNRGQMD
jgi:uncharacterized protein (DUF58 family)